MCESETLLYILEVILRMILFTVSHCDSTKQAFFKRLNMYAKNEGDY